MKCTCGHNTIVKDSRPQDEHQWRMRYCDACGTKFTTIEQRCESVGNMRGKPFAAVKPVAKPKPRSPRKPRGVVSQAHPWGSGGDPEVKVITEKVPVLPKEVVSRLDSAVIARRAIEDRKLDKDKDLW